VDDALSVVGTDARVVQTGDVDKAMDGAMTDPDRPTTVTHWLTPELRSSC
jgi:hypothetical protein